MKRCKLLGLLLLAGFCSTLLAREAARETSIESTDSRREAPARISPLPAASTPETEMIKPSRLVISKPVEPEKPNTTPARPSTEPSSPSSVPTSPAPRPASSGASPEIPGTSGTPPSSSTPSNNTAEVEPPSRPRPAPGETGSTSTPPKPTSENLIPARPSEPLAERQEPSADRQQPSLQSPIPDSEQSIDNSRPVISTTGPESSPDDSVATSETDIDSTPEPSTSQPVISEESVPIIEQGSPLESGDTTPIVSEEPPPKDIDLAETPEEKIEETPPDKVPPQKLQRGGFLTNMPAPQAPAVIDKKNRVKPLNQWLIEADDMATAEKQRRYLAPFGGRIVSRKRLDGLGLVLSTFRFNESVDVKKVLEEFKAKFAESAIEANKRYRLLGNSSAFSKHQVYGQQMTGFGSPSICTQPLTIAMLDSEVNTALPFLSPDRVKTVDITRQTSRSQQHGTAVATIMAADGDAFPSLLPNAQLYAVNVFALDENGDPETRTDWLLYGLNQLTTFDPAPSVVNMSFGGEPSHLLERAFRKLSTQMVFVAAAGNDGTNDLVYPAAYPSVIAVGGVNAKKQRSRRSNYGDHVPVFAPGEDIWTSNGEGNGHYVSGTSYASPFVSVALAIVISSGGVANDYLASLEVNKLANIKNHCGG